MKKSLKKLLLCSTVLLLLNCQSEDLALDSHEHSKLRIQRISLEELQSKPKVLEALKKVRENSKIDAQGKMTYNSANDFYVDTEEIVYIEKEEIHSYTFAVYREESTAYFENLVMTLQEDGSYSSTLVGYNLTEQEKYNLDHEQLYSLDGKMSATVLNAGSVGNELLMNRTSCTTIQIPTCSYGGHTHLAGANCTKIDGSIDITICTDISEPHAPISYISPGGSGGSSGGGGGSPSTQTPIASNPTPEPTVLPNLQSPINNIGNVTVPLVKPSPFERFIAGLDDDEETWLNAHVTIKAIITNHIGQNTQDIGFAQDLVEYCTNNNLNNENAKKYVVSNIIEKQIDDTDLDECTKGILNRLKTLQQNDIAKIISKLGNVDSPYKVKISSATNSELNWNELATTNWQIENGDLIPYNYNIKIKTSYTSVGTDLGIASTILHELVHAYFLSLIDDCHYENNCEQLQAFPEVWNYYVQHTSTNGVSQHEQLAQSYANILAVALQEFHTGIPLANGQMPLQLYKDLAWGGLQGTIPYQALSNSDVFRINKTDTAENYNQPQYNITGTALEYFPQGTPCP